jgi:hypothetical protein
MDEKLGIINDLDLFCTTLPYKLKLLIREELEINSDSQNATECRSFKDRLTGFNLEELESVKTEMFDFFIAYHNRKSKNELSKPFWDRDEYIADFEYWAKFTHWKLEEAVALALGKNPKKITAYFMKQYKDDFQMRRGFIRNYFELAELVHRSRYIQELNSYVTPTEFILWAENKGLNINSNLVAAIKSLVELQSNISCPLCSTPKNNHESKILSYNAYTTKFMQILGEVIDKFWLNFDPEQPDTAVSSKIIINWIMKERGLSFRAAQAIDAIARADSMKKGGKYI